MSPEISPVSTTSLHLLLIASASPSASAVATELRLAMGATVQTVSTLKAAQAALRDAAFDAVLLEAAIPPEHPDALEALYELAGTATVVEISFGLINVARVVRQVRHARRQQEATEVRRQLAARRMVQMELRGALAGLRLQSELALRSSGPELDFHLTALAQVAESIALQVQIGGTAPLPVEDLHLRDKARPAST